jgi:hypothetical protein
VLAADGHHDRLRECPRDVFPAAAPAADAVLVGWAAYAHLQGAERRRRYLTDARARLEPGGILIVSFFMLPGLERYQRVVHAVARNVRRLRPGEPVPEPGDLLRPMFLHCSSEPEVRAECAAAGFAVEELHLEPYPHLVARAI